MLKVCSSQWGERGCIQLNVSDCQLLLTAHSVHSSLAFAGSYCTVSQNRWVSSKVKISDQDHSVDMSFRIFRKMKQVYKPYRMMSRELKKRRSSCHHKVSSKKIQILKVLKHFWGYSIFALGLEPDFREKRGMTVFCIPS